MIHSCAGGVVHEKKLYDFAKVKIECTGQIRWYISNNPLLRVGDKVVVPFGKEREKAVVLKLDKNVSEQVSPMPIRQMKEILQVIYD